MTTVRYPVTIEGETVEIGTAAELAVALDVLQGQHDRAVLEQLGPHLASVIATPAGLYGTLKSLSPADQLFLVQSLGPCLADVVRDAPHLRDILAMLAAVEVEEALLNTLGTAGLSRLIVTADELAEVLEWVYGDCDRLALELLGIERLQRMFRTGYDLSVVLLSLDNARQVELIERLGWGHVARLAVSGRDLAYLVRALPAATSKELLAHYTRQELVRLIGNERDWAFLCQRLEAEEAAFLFDKLGVAGNA